MALLEVHNFSILYKPLSKYIVKDVSFSVDEGSIVSIVGESGSGKTLTAISILGLLPDTMKACGKILFEGTDLIHTYASSNTASIRGKKIGMIFQDPMTALNPVMLIRDQYAKILKSHYLKSGHFNLLKEIFIKMNIQEVDRVLNSFPHQLSGGMIQRIVMSFVLSLKPKLIICDEITTSLDVTIQKEITKILKSITKDERISIIFITHDLSLAREISDKMIIMYAGTILESGETENIYSTPLHPYTKALISSIPSVNEKKKTLDFLEGRVPYFSELKTGCVFFSRCQMSEKGLCDISDIPILEKHNHVRCIKV